MVDTQAYRVEVIPGTFEEVRRNAIDDLPQRGTLHPDATWATAGLRVDTVSLNQVGPNSCTALVTYRQNVVGYIEVDPADQPVRRSVRGNLGTVQTQKDYNGDPMVITFGGQEYVVTAQGDEPSLVLTTTYTQTDDPSDEALQYLGTINSLAYKTLAPRQWKFSIRRRRLD